MDLESSLGAYLIQSEVKSEKEIYINMYAWACTHTHTHIT